MSKLKTILERMSRASARKTLNEKGIAVSDRDQVSLLHRRSQKVDLLPAHTIPRPGRKRLESLFVVFQETRVEQSVGLWQETLWVEDAWLDPVGRIVLHVLKIDTNDRLRREERVTK